MIGRSRCLVVASDDPLASHPGGWQTSMRYFLAECEAPQRYAIAAPQWGALHRWCDRPYLDRRFPYYRLADARPITLSSRRLATAIDVALQLHQLYSFDTVFTHGPELLVPFIARGHRGRLVLTVIGDLASDVRYGKNRAFGVKGVSEAYLRMTIAVMRRCDRIIWVDPRAPEAVPPDVQARSDVLAAPYDPRVFHHPERFARNEEARLLVVGRLSRVKRVDAALHALRHAVAAGRTWRLVVCGDGECAADLRTLATELEISDRVEWAGNLNHDRLSEVMRRSDVGLLMSASEGSPTVVKEMLASGLPVVATRVGDNAVTIRDGVNGRLIESPDPATIVDAVEQMLSLSDAARRAASEPISASNVRSWVAAMETLLAD